MRSAAMTIIRHLLLIVFLSTFSQSIWAQKERERNKITAEDGQKKAAEDEAAAQKKMQEQDKLRREHHKDIQTKETRKRMKKNLKKAERHSWGKDVPWYKRWFRKKRK